MKRLRYKHAFWEVNRSRTQALPFPGRTPTRWNIIIATFQRGGKSKIVFHYRGKPDNCIKAKVVRLANRIRGQIWMFEFDKAGPFRGCVRNLPRSANDFALTASCNQVTAFYYYFGSGTNFFTENKQYVKYGVRRQKAFFFFAPYEKMEGEAFQEQLRQYRRWLGESKVMEKIKKGPRLNLPRHIEAIRFDSLPKPPIPKLFSILCPSCGRRFTKPESYRGMIVSCPTCSWNVMAL